MSNYVKSAGALLSLVIVWSCAQGVDVKGIHTTRGLFFIKGGSGYFTEVKGFNVDEIGARALVQKELRKKNVDHEVVGTLFGVVGGNYLFSVPKRKTGVGLRGWYVDGNSGNVQFIEDRATLEYSDYPDLLRVYRNDMERIPAGE